MKKIMFLMAFLAGISFSAASFAQVFSPDDDGPSFGNMSPDDGPSFGNMSPSTGDINLDVEVDDDSSDTGVVKNRVFTPSEAAGATKDNSQNSVTINF